MALSPQQVDRLLQKIQQTREEEMTCPECLDELDKYTQRILDGVPIDGLLTSVADHLAACPCCHNQFQMVLEALQSLDE